jgi:hypothetical protein
MTCLPSVRGPGRDLRVCHPGSQAYVPIWRTLSIVFNQRLSQDSKCKFSNRNILQRAAYLPAVLALGLHCHWQSATNLASEAFP